MTSEPGTDDSTAVSMRSLTVSCFIEVDSPKMRLYQGIPTLPSSSWTMIVVGVSSAGSGVLLVLSSPASSVASEGAGAPDCASFDEAWVASGAGVSLFGVTVDCTWFSSSAAKAAGMLTVVAARAPVTTSASTVIDRWDISGSLG